MTPASIVRRTLESREFLCAPHKSSVTDSDAQLSVE